MGNLVKFRCVAMRVVVASGEISLRTVFSPGIYSVILWQFFFFFYLEREGNFSFTIQFRAKKFCSWKNFFED